MSSSSSSSSVDTGLMDIDSYFDFLQIPIEDIESATNNFSDENQITQSPTSSSKLYKGQLINSSGESINVTVQKSSLLNLAMNEIYMSRYMHKNIKSTYKMSWTEDSELVIVNKDEASERLDAHLSGSTPTWIQRLKICVAVADALSYLHFDAEVNHSVIHCDIKSSNILLDRNWEPKLKGFQYAVRTKKHHLQLISKYNGALQYMDPAYEKSKGLTHKSDVFSFGVVLFEVLFGREASISISDEDNWCFVRLARLHYEKKTLDEMIDPDLRQQMDLESFNIFSDTAYCCVKEQRSQRLNMTQILRRLERALELQHIHEHSTAVVEGRSPCLKGRNLDYLKFRLSDIELATNKFSKTHCIGSGGYGMVYKAKLDHYDDINSTLIEGKNIDETPKKNSTVAIKRIFSRVDGQGEQGFIAEIEMLSNCKHPNIVSLLGFCDEGPEMILVYEFCPNGSLDEYLGNTDNITNLTWAQRIQISIDIAHGLKYLHTSTECRDSIIHRDIKSANILLDENWVAKIADFGLSKLHHACQQGSTLVTFNIAGTELYLDPEYLSTGKLKTKSDVYSFGVVLFEIMCGKLAYDKSYNEKGLPSVARQCFSEGMIKKLVDPKIKEADENISLLNGGVNQDSLETFSKIAYQCVAETQSERPTMEVIIKELEKALNYQKNSKDNLHMSLKALSLGTQDFSDSNCIGEGRLWKLYHGEVQNANGRTTIVAKRWGSKSRQGHHQFLTELEILFKYKHKNIIGLAGYCNEMDEKIIVYEHASNGRLDKHLDEASLTWTKRLKICIDIASGLGFLHEGGAEKEESMKHTDIKSSCILLDGDWNAKITNLELSRKILEFETVEHATDKCSLGYVDPLYHKEGFLTLGSDTYSLGVVLLEILCGRLAWGEGCEDHSQSLGPLAQRHYEEHDNLEELVFPGIRDQIVPQSLNVFQKIAIQCLDDDRCSRPLEAARLIRKLKKALEFQEDHEIWESKLPQDYKEILQMSETPEIYNNKKMKELNDILIEGVLLQEGTLWLSLSNTGERNEMISARMFSYENHKTYKRRSIKKSRFKTAVKMLDISNLNIQIKIKTQFLSPNVIYGANLVFKFCDPRKISSQPRYVNLKYKMGGKSLHACFATQMDNEWMMIELCRFLNYKKDTDFGVLIESLSRYYCGSGAIYVEGIEFRVVDNVKPEEIERIKELQQVLKLGSNMDQEQQSPASYCDENFKNSENDGNSEKMCSLNEVNGKKQRVLPAKEILYKYPNVKVFRLNSTVDSRFQEVIEILPQQVFGIKCKIGSHMLSRDTKYLCYLVFKLSEECHGLHCPVKVRNLLDRKKKETGIIYFRSPSPWNLQKNINRVPKQREDGWMEVNVWELNSNVLNDGCVRVNLKLISYEGTMSGLIVSGLEFRPV